MSMLVKIDFFSFIPFQFGVNLVAFRHVGASAGSRRHLFEYVPCTLGGIAKHEQHVKSRHGGQESFRKRVRLRFIFSLSSGCKTH